MAKVILTTIMASPDQSWAAGDEYECSDTEAARLIENGSATTTPATKRGPRRETATAPAATENADA